MTKERIGRLVEFGNTGYFTLPGFDEGFVRHTVKHTDGTPGSQFDPALIPSPMHLMDYIRQNLPVVMTELPKLEAGASAVYTFDDPEGRVTGTIGAMTVADAAIRYPGHVITRGMRDPGGEAMSLLLPSGNIMPVYRYVTSSNGTRYQRPENLLAIGSDPLPPTTRVTCVVRANSERKLQIVTAHPGETMLAVPVCRLDSEGRVEKNTLEDPIAISYWDNRVFLH